MSKKSSLVVVLLLFTLAFLAITRIISTQVVDSYHSVRSEVGKYDTPFHTIRQSFRHLKPLELDTVESQYETFQFSKDSDLLEAGVIEPLFETESPLQTLVNPSSSSSINGVSSSDTTYRRPTGQETTCTDKRCINLLSPSSYNLYKKCGALQMKKNISDADIPYNCVFRSARGQTSVLLPSLPGSGNTWVRGLLEKATGICTGSFYCDRGLRKKGFVGESIRDGNVLVTKLHTAGFDRFHKIYGSAILLIRNPLDAIVAERRRQSSGTHVGMSKKAAFVNNKVWDKRLRVMAGVWWKMLVNWFGSAQRYNYPVLVVRYEDVKRDKVREVSRMLDFLHQDYDKTELATRLEAGFEDFHRQHTNDDDFDPYTEEQRAFVKSAISKAMSTLKSMNISHENLHLNEYLA